MKCSAKRSDKVLAPEDSYRAHWVIKCACVGGDSNVPLGFISLTENLMMMAMALWMLGQIML
jgi:hypothetical protein